MSDAFRVGDLVTCTEHYGSHADHSIEKETVYAVTASAPGKEGGISINNKCRRNIKDDQCECQRIGKPYWSERCFTVAVVKITAEEVKQAKPLPSIQDTAAFFGMRNS